MFRDRRHSSSSCQRRCHFQIFLSFRTRHSYLFCHLYLSPSVHHYHPLSYLSSHQPRLLSSCQLTGYFLILFYPFYHLYLSLRLYLLYPSLFHHDFLYPSHLLCLSSCLFQNHLRKSLYLCCPCLPYLRACQCPEHSLIYPSPCLYLPLSAQP